jgi:hypothetical protein
MRTFDPKCESRIFGLDRIGLISSPYLGLKTIRNQTFTRRSPVSGYRAKAALPPTRTMATTWKTGSCRITNMFEAFNSEFFSTKRKLCSICRDFAADTLL